MQTPFFIVKDFDFPNKARMQNMFLRNNILGWLLLIASPLFLSRCSKKQIVDQGNSVQFEVPSKIEWMETTHDFGSVANGPALRHRFEFTNVGAQPLKIQDVRLSSDNTIADWTRQPILPNDTGWVELEMLTAQNLGKFRRIVFVLANTVPPKHSLTIEGELAESK